jgi:peroxiredoxin
MAVETPICEFGLQAPDFSLKGIDGRIHTLRSVAGPKGTLVMFICNHCPYVQAIADDLATQCRELARSGVSSVAIMSNDVATYPADSFENMVLFAENHYFSFPYLYDETQNVAKAYGAVCTPDFFGYNADLELQYRGRFNSSQKIKAPAGTTPELLEAMQAVAATGMGPKEQIPSMGCSIKWKNA